MAAAAVAAHHGGHRNHSVTICLPTGGRGVTRNKDPIMTMILGLITTLAMLTVGFVLGRIWEIRRAMLSKQWRATEELERERRAEDELMRQQAVNRFISARRWA
jgi:hypothetical protein